LHVGFRTSTTYVVKHNWLAVTWGFRQANVSWNDGRENLSAEETAQVGGNLARERGALVVHGKQDAFDAERGI
jgi:hypothetical protein